MDQDANWAMGSSALSWPNYSGLDWKVENPGLTTFATSAIAWLSS